MQTFRLPMCLLITVAPCSSCYAFKLQDHRAPKSVGAVLSHKIMNAWDESLVAVIRSLTTVQFD